MANNIKSPSYQHITIINSKQRPTLPVAVTTPTAHQIHHSHERHMSLRPTTHLLKRSLQLTTKAAIHYSPQLRISTNIMSTPAFSLPSQMKSLLQPSRTSTSLILTNSPVPKPTHPDDVLVRVAAASPCAGELLWAINFPASVPTEKEMVPCQDLAGTVVTSPSNSGFVPGDKVYCRIEATRAGTAREYALARVSELAEIPKNLGWVEAAATPLSALTAWQALFVQGGLDPRGVKQGEKEARERNGKIRVLITGAAGGVGSWVVQFAKLAGAKGVVAVCGGDKESAARELGATEVVNYQKQSIEQWVGEKPEEREVDLVIDMIGGASLKGCWHAVKKGGVLVSVNTPPDMVKPEGLEKEVAKSLFFIVEPSGRNLAEIGELIEARKVRPVVDSVWEFEEFEKAFERLESGHAKGKIIIKVSDEVTV